jgi:hypothetical protein
LFFGFDAEYCLYGDVIVPFAEARGQVRRPEVGQVAFQEGEDESLEVVFILSHHVQAERTWKNKHRLRISGHKEIISGQMVNIHITHCLIENLTLDTIVVSKRMLPLEHQFRQSEGTLYDFKKQT